MLDMGNLFRVSLNLVGAEGFEPPTLCSQSRCATRLRYAPMPCDDREAMIHPRCRIVNLMKISYFMRQVVPLAPSSNNTPFSDK